MSEHWRTHQIGSCISWVIRPPLYLYLFPIIIRKPFQTCLCVKMGLNVERNDKKTKHGFIISAATEISSPPNYGRVLQIRKWESDRICHGSQYVFSSVRSSNSHPDLLLTQHPPLFQIHTSPQHWT